MYKYNVTIKILQECGNQSNKIKRPLFKIEGQFTIFLNQIIFQITFSDKKRFKSPKAWGVILKFTAVNIKFTTQQKYVTVSQHS